MPESTMLTTDPARAGPPQFLVCAQCAARIAHTSQLVSRAFRGHSGKAALFTTAKNVTLDPPSILLMDSGAYTIQEFICQTCDAYLGWKFVRAHDGPERWKEGHYILELDLVLEQDAGADGARYSPDALSPLGRIDEDSESPAHHRRSPSALAPVPPPKGVQQGRRSMQAVPKRVPRRLDLDEFDEGGGPFWKPR